MCVEVFVSGSSVSSVQRKKNRGRLLFKGRLKFEARLYRVDYNRDNEKEKVIIIIYKRTKAYKFKQNIYFIYSFQYIASM